MNESEG